MKRQEKYTVYDTTHRELGSASRSSSDNSGKGDEREFHDDI
jgi:hypothetical protein